MHPIGMLLRKSPPPGPSFIAASALIPSIEAPSTSKNPHAAASDSTSSDDGPPPSKTRRQSAPIVNAVMRSAAPLEAVQVSMSGFSDATNLSRSPQKSAPFPDLTNQLVVQGSSEPRPKRTNAKPLPKDWLDDPASDEEDSTSSAFEPDADHVSENDVDLDNLSDPDGDDLGCGPTPCITGGLSSYSGKDDAYAVEPSGLDLDARDVVDTPSYTGELLSSWRRTLIDSAQMTVFDCPPPPIPCRKVPKLKLFHELTDAERDIFEGPDKIASSCTYCGTAPAKQDRIDGAGTSGLYEHFYNNGEFHVCTWPGCASTFSSFQALLWHYGCYHDRRFAQFKCDKCEYVALTRDALATHVKKPHPASEEEAKATSSLNSRRRLVVWKHPKFCDKCEKWYPENERTRDKIHHSGENLEFDNTLPVRGLQIPCLRGATCPFNDCYEPYRDFIGWYLHCTSRHSEYILAAGNLVPMALTTEERARVPMFRCTNCFLCVPFAQVCRHHEKCAARMLPETVGPLMRQRAAVYNMEPGMLELVYGQIVMKERRFAGLLREVIVSTAYPQQIEGSLRAIQSDPFLRSFTKRNQDAPVSNVLYVVSRIRHNNVPEIGEWAKDRIVYVGSTTDVTQRVRKHTVDTLSRWHDMGLTLQADEDLYLMRMCITLDEQTSVASFNEPDLKRLEQVLVDALGMGTLYNVKRVFSPEGMLNDVTYRNHMAPRLYQLALVLLESTHKRLKRTSFSVDNKNVWKMPITRKELNNSVRLAPAAGSVANLDSANGSIGQETVLATRVDQACSPVPAPRLLSPEVYDGYMQLQAARGYTDEQMFERLRAWRSSKSTLCHPESLNSNESLRPAGGSGQSGLLDQRSVASPDLFPDYPNVGETKTIIQDRFFLDGVPSSSNGPDYHALKEHHDSLAYASKFRRASTTKPDESHMPVDESEPSGLPRQPSAGPSDGPMRPEVSASKTVPAKAPSHCISPLVIEKRIVRIGRYRGRSTQYVDLDGEPRDLSDDSASESSVDEPSPTDSGFCDFENITDKCNGPESLIEVTDGGITTTEPTGKAKAATASDIIGDKEEEEADSDTYDTCAYKNCLRPQHENINWVQCDDCDEWYHNLCILGTDEAVEEDEFHCGCPNNGKWKPDQADHSKKRQAL